MDEQDLSWGGRRAGPRPARHPAFIVAGVIVVVNR
jgi:hypothetical protein